MNRKYNTINFDRKIPASIRFENLNSNTRKTELVWHREPEIIYLLSGSAECIVNGEKTLISEGGFVLLNSEDIYLIRPSEGSSCSFMLMLFSVEYLKQFKSSVDGMLFDINNSDWAKKQISALLGKIAKSYESDSGNIPLLLISYINQIYYLILEYCVCYKRPQSSSGISKRDFAYAKTAISYINENYSREIPLDEIASIVNLSPSYFSKYFKRVTQISFSEYLANLRLEKAVGDMLQKNSSVSAAAMDNGFANVKSFITHCKKVYGCTPAQYKKKLLNK